MQNAEIVAVYLSLSLSLSVCMYSYTCIDAAFIHTPGSQSTYAMLLK
jgi:hypothetical protein